MTEIITGLLQLKTATTTEERQQVIALLQQEHLPVTDINDDTVLYLLQQEENTIGTIVLDIFEDCALLRSVSIVKEQQGKGSGKFMNTAIENYAKESGINCLYLLTTSAKPFFEKQGYCVIAREEAPAVIKQSAEFTALCPASAVLMKKRL